MIDYKWQDHHAPCIDVLFAACDDMFKFIKEDERNIVVVHCKAGKGRTGTIIACLLMYSGLVDNAE